MNGLILFSHGSLLCGAGEALEAHAARLRESDLYDQVRIGYLNYSEPRFSQTVRDLAAVPVTEIVVAPYFLVSGYFVGKSLPEAVAAAQREFPEIRFRVAAALNEDDILAAALLESAQTAQTAEQWSKPLRRASRACRPDAGCPLFGTPACPKVPNAAAAHDFRSDDT